MKISFSGTENVSRPWKKPVDLVKVIVPMKPGKPNQKSRKTDRYTVTEVGTLLEAMDGKINHVLEGHVGLDRRLEKLEVAVHGNNRRLDHLELNVNVLNGKASRLEDAVSMLSKDLRETREELRKELKDTRQELGGKIDRFDKRLITVESHG